MIRTRFRLGRIAAAVVLGAALSALPPAQRSHAGTVDVLNAVQFEDSNGNALQAHGGGMIKVGSYYYWFGENRDGVNLVSVYRSTDLRAWSLRAHVLRRDMGGELATANIERPKVLFNAVTGTYVLWAHKENGRDYAEARVAVATASDVEGPYTYRESFRPLGYDSRDMTVFNDGGTAYLISSTRVNADLNIYRLTPDFLHVESLVQTLWRGQYREAPALFKRDSTYFLITSGATGWDPNQAKYGTASSISGAWSDLENLADATTYGSQSTYVLPIEGDSSTSYLYMGDRWAPGWSRPVNESKYVWLPLSFPSSTTLAMTYSASLEIDAAAGTLRGVAFSVDPNATYDIINRRSNSLLTVAGSSTAEGADLEQRVDRASASQQWRLVAVDDGYYQIQNRNSGLVLDVEGGSSTNGARIEQRRGEDGSASQHWRLVDAGGGFCKLRNRATGKLADVTGSSLSSGASVIQFDDNGGANQQWQLVATDSTGP